MSSLKEYWKQQARDAKYRAIERINEMREITRREWEDREYAYRAVCQMEREQHRKPVSSDSLHRFVFETSLKHALGQFFYKSDCAEWIGTDSQVICLAARPDIPVRDQHEIIRRISMDKFLGCAMLSPVMWSFPRFEIDTNAPTPTTKPIDPDLRRKSIFEK